MSGDVPVPVRFNHGDQGVQRYVQATDHWKSLAGEVASQAVGVLGDRPVTVEVASNGRSQFENEFAKFLESALVRQHAHVVDSPAAVRLTVETGLIDFDNWRKSRRLDVAERHERPSLVGSHRWLALPTTATQGIPHWEMTLTVRGKDGPEVPFSYTEAFYIPDADAGLYQVRSSGRTLPLTR